MNQELAMEPRHSGIGIASFVVSIIAGIAMFFLTIAAGVIEVSTPGGMHERSPVAIILGLSLLAFWFLSLVALGLGIGGLFQRSRKRLFAILGAVFSAITFMGALLMTLAGLAAD